MSRSLKVVVSAVIAIVSLLAFARLIEAESYAVAWSVAFGLGFIVGAIPE